MGSSLILKSLYYTPEIHSNNFLWSSGSLFEACMNPNMKTENHASALQLISGSTFAIQ